MARIFGTINNETYAGTIGIEDIAVIDARGKDITFRSNGTSWTTFGSQGIDQLDSIERVELIDAMFELRLGGVRTLGSTSAIDGVQLSNGNYVIAKGYGSGMSFQILNDGNEPLTGLVSAGVGQNPFVIARDDGGFWLGYSNGEVFLQAYDASGTASGGAITVNTSITGTQNLMQMIELPNGNLVLPWRDLNDNTLKFQMLDSTGAKVGTETTFSLGGAVSDFDMIGLANGRFVAIARAGGTATYQMFNADGSLNGGLGTVGADTGFYGSEVSLFTADTGFGIAWGSGNGIEVRLFNGAGTQQSADITLPTSLVRFQDMVQLESGEYAVSYHNTANSQAFLQLMSRDGNLIGQPTTIDANSATVSQLFAMDDGGVGIGWYRGVGGGFLRANADGDMQLATISGDAAPNTITVSDYIGPSYVNAGYELNGRGGNDTLIGARDADRLVGGQGADTLIGGEGDDLYVVDNYDTIIEAANEGIDTVRVTSTYVLTADNVENLMLAGNAAADLTGNILANVLTGNDSDNVLNGAEGADRMVGRGGNDTYLVDNASDVVVEDAGDGVDMVISTIASYTMADETEILRLQGNAAMTGIGNALDNRIYGTDDDNVLDGGAGADLLFGGGGDDSYRVDAGDEVIEAANAGEDTVLAATSWALSQNVENLGLLEVANGNFNGTGNELNNEIGGNSYNNILDGGEGADRLIGRGGDDTYIVDNEADGILELLNQGTDTVETSVTYTLSDNVENLTQTGTASIDATGNYLSNVMRGNDADNVINGDLGSDTIFGNGGDDTLISFAGVDKLYGGTGNDTYEVKAGGNDTIVELRNQGYDTVIASSLGSDDFYLSNNIEKLVLTGSGGGNAYGNDLDNRIEGNSGNNLIDGGDGDDSLAGGAGNDSYIVDSIDDVVEEKIGEGRDEVLSSVDYTLRANLEDLILTGSRDLKGVGNSENNRLVGNSGNNTLLGSLGNDILIAGGGDNILAGGQGDDRIVSGIGSDNMKGDDGIDLASYVGMASGVTVRLALTGFQETGAGGRDRLTGIENVDGSNRGNDELTGNALDNVLRGLGGDDILEGGLGNDKLRGGEGNDILFADAGNDAFLGGNGIDTVDFRRSTSGVEVDLNDGDRQDTGNGNDRLRSIENLSGSAQDDVFRGDFRDNTIFGAKGDDIIFGSAGNDVLDGGGGSDTVDYSASYSGMIVDIRLGHAENEFGESDQLINFQNVVGSEFDDAINGNGAANELTGGYGRDILFGGSGNDVFIFRDVGETGRTEEDRDLILDFRSGDKIDLSQIDADRTTAGDQAFSEIIDAATAFTKAGQLKLVDGILYGNIDSDAAAEFSIDLNNVTEVALTDFIL